MSDRAIRLTGAYAALSALAVLIISPLLSLAYFATPDGAYELESSTVTMWATPATNLAGGLLTFGSHERVYGTYLQAFALIFPSILLCAWVARSRRPEFTSRPERWSWRAAIAGYAIMSAGLAIAFCLEAASWVVGTDPHNGPLNVVFLGLLIPGILLSTLGSSVLGVTLIRSRYSPRATAWILTLSFPGWILGSFVFGHNSLGLIPLFIAWGVTGLELWSPRPSHEFDPAVATTD